MPKWSVEASSDDDKRVAQFLAVHKDEFKSKKDFILVAVRQYLDHYKVESQHATALHALESIDFDKLPKVTSSIGEVIKTARNDRIR